MVTWVWLGGSGQGDAEVDRWWGRGPGLGGGAAVDAVVGSLVVVVGDEGVELGLQFGEVGGRWAAAEPFLEGLLEAFDLAAGLGVVGAGRLGDDTDGAQLDLEADLEAAQTSGEVEPIVAELSQWHPPQGGGLAERLPGGVGGGFGQCLDAQRDTGVVIEEAENPHPPIGGGDPVDAVGLPQLVGG